MKATLILFATLLSRLVLASPIPELTPSQVFDQKGCLRIVDVRTPEEFVSDSGHIEGAVLVTLGEELSDFLKSGNRKERIVFVCRSGKRSARATEESLRLGYEATYSMKGGMLEWVAQGLPTTQK
ncbi:rhodanese-like domain-containing protein [bacterium]|nr:rhodanese-like domain-containing protein [bacterium]